MAGQAAGAAVLVREALEQDERRKRGIVIQENSKSSVLAEFRRSAGSWPARTAVVSGEVSLTFAELADRVERLSAVLRSLVIGPEQSVVSCLAPRAFWSSTATWPK
ncbi:AMP-binding protein [Kitasatospora griseola]|uniref:AMP-binding protein n=1 Tax=Kitasatospora griseola TaxID=2064 RepID=UPI00380A6EC7